MGPLVTRNCHPLPEKWNVRLIIKSKLSKTTIRRRNWQTSKKSIIFSRPNNLETSLVHEKFSENLFQSFSTTDIQAFFRKKRHIFFCGVFLSFCVKIKNKLSFALFNFAISHSVFIVFEKILRLTWSFFQNIYPAASGFFDLLHNM